MQRYLVVDNENKEVFNTDFLPDGIHLAKNKTIIDLMKFEYSFGQAFKEIEQDHL